MAPKKQMPVSSATASGFFPMPAPPIVESAVVTALQSRRQPVGDPSHGRSDDRTIPLRAVTAIVDTPEQAAALELPPLLVRRPLEAYLDAHGLGAGPLAAEPLGEGHSNITYLIRRDGQEWVLRRPPRPPLPPSAHDVLREATLLTAVADADVRTPRVLLACDDESVIGAPFYVMERVEGDVVTTEIPEPLDNREQR